MAKKATTQVPTARGRFGDYVRALAPLMGLGHWEIETPAAAAADGVDGQVRCVSGRSRAAIWVGDWVLGDPGGEEKQRYVAVHELIHCHFAHPDELAEEELAGKAHAAWTLANEYAVDALARVIAPFLPLPAALLDEKGGVR